MILQQLLYLPAYYKNRQEAVNTVMLSNLNIEKKENQLICNCIANRKYQVSIIINGRIQSSSEIMIDCTCESFKYEFAYTVGRDKSLIYPNRYLKTISKDKNKFLHLTGCKHLIKFGSYIFANKIKIERSFNNVIK